MVQKVSGARRIKVLFGINKLAVGGGERLVLHQVKRIDPIHFDAHLVTLLPSSVPNLDSDASHIGSKWKKLKFRGFLDVASWWLLYQYLRNERFDVVYANLFFTGVILRICAFFARVPVILVSELNVYDYRSKTWVIVERILSLITDRIVGVSQIVIDASSKQLRLPKSKYVLAYSAIDTSAEEFHISKQDRVQSRNSFGYAPSDIVILTAGRLVEQKGQKYLIEAFDMVRKENKHLRLKLVIAGRGALRDELHHQIQALYLDGDAILHDHMQLRDILSITDIFVLPSLWEGMPLVLLEASAGGLPIIASKVGGVPEVIKDNENGFLVPPGDARTLANRINDLLTDPVLRSRFGTAAAHDSNRFSIERNLATFSALIHKELEAKNPYD